MTGAPGFEITAVIITANAGAVLERAVRSVAWCDELVLVDDNSTDGSVAAALRAFPGSTTVLQRRLTSFADQKQAGADAARGAWWLSIDSDEEVSAELAASLRRLVREPGSAAGGEVERLNYFLGRPLRHSGQSPNWIVRAARHDAGRWQGTVHESLRVTGPVERIAGLLLHDSGDTLGDRLHKLRHYSSLSARDGAARGQTLTLAQALTRGPRQLRYLLVAKCAWRDGWRGVLWAALVAAETGTAAVKLWRAGLRTARGTAGRSG